MRTPLIKIFIFLIDESSSEVLQVVEITSEKLQPVPGHPSQQRLESEEGNQTNLSSCQTEFDQLIPEGNEDTGLTFKMHIRNYDNLNFLTASINVPDHIAIETTVSQPGCLDTLGCRMEVLGCHQLSFLWTFGLFKYLVPPNNLGQM